MVNRDLMRSCPAQPAGATKDVPKIAGRILHLVPGGVGIGVTSEHHLLKFPGFVIRNIDFGSSRPCRNEIQSHHPVSSQIVGSRSSQRQNSQLSLLKALPSRRQRPGMAPGRRS
jgi:hypothetical protein